MTLAPVHLLVFPLVLSLAALFIAAALYDVVVFRNRKKRNKAVYRCTACRHIYEEKHRIPLARCPKCGQANGPVRT